MPPSPRLRQPLTISSSRSGAHFQTCAQAQSPTGEVQGLKGRANVSNQDTADDPQININQETVVDYVASPRISVTTNWTRYPPSDDAWCCIRRKFSPVTFLSSQKSPRPNPKP